MRGLYHHLAPFTPDSSGACAVFADMAALIMLLDMNGTMSVFRGRVDVEEGSPVRVCSALGAHELTYVMGRDDDFLEALCEIVDEQESDFCVLVQGPVSSAIGVDLVGLADRLEQYASKPVFPVECSGLKFYDAGIQRALQSVFERVAPTVSSSSPKQPGAYNVCGLNSVDHNDARLRTLLAQKLADHAGEAGTAISYWGCRGSWRDWQAAASAERSVVVSVAGAKIAREMERQWDIPYQFLDDIDLFWCNGEIAASLRRAAAGKRILVVGEQLSANVVRNAIVGDAVENGASANGAVDAETTEGKPIANDAAAADVTVGCFFETIADHRQAQDVRFASERECAELLASGAFDVVIGDRALRPLLTPETTWYDLPHSAIATPRHGTYEDAPVALSEEWFAGLAQALDEAREGSLR